MSEKREVGVWYNHDGSDWPEGLNDSDVVTVMYPDGATGQMTAEAYIWSWEIEGPSDFDIVKFQVIEKGPDLTTRLVPTEEVKSNPNPKDAVGSRKAPLSTIPMGVVAEMGVAMLEGASKYGRHNYRGSNVLASVYFDGTMRHLIDWWEGVDIDPDSGMHHITKALTSLTVLRDAQMQGTCIDDRPPRSVTFYPELHKKTEAIVDKYADKKPYHYTIKDSKESHGSE